MTQTIRGKSAAGMLMIAALTLGAGGELRAQAGAGMMASPWTGSMQPGNNASIGGDLPSDVTWEHELCVHAYSFENLPAQIAGARAKLANEIDAFIATAREEGRVDRQIESLVEERFAAYRSELERRIAAAEERASSAREIVSQCKGTFFRPAVEQVCSGDAAWENRFCAQLGGTTLPGIRFSSDRFAFAHALAATHLETLGNPVISMAPGDWDAAFLKTFEQPQYGMRVNDEGTIYFQTENGPRLPLLNNSLLYEMRKARAEELAAASRTGIGFIYAMNEVVNRVSGEEVPGAIGQWAFSIEMERALKSELAPGAMDLVRRMEQRTGFVGDLGEYAQAPLIHFQAHMPGILVQSDYVRLAVANSDGTETPLQDNAWFESGEDRRAFFFTNSKSYRIHASVLPTADDLAAILEPGATHLVARFEMLLQDGSIDLVTLRTPLTGIADQWTEMNAANRQTAALIAQMADEWDERHGAFMAELAADQERREREQRLALQKAEQEARAYLEANAFVDNCPSLPVLGGLTTDASEANRQISEVNVCQALWLPKARETISALVRLESRYSAFGGREKFISDELARWREALARRTNAVANFKVELAEHNRRVNEHNARAASQIRVAAASPSPAVRRQRSYERRRPSQAERTAADDFYEAQSKPYVSYFRDVTIPPTPTGYMGTGYW